MNNEITLLNRLANSDMLEIDGLHAWQFELDAGALRVECVDGRTQRRWQFSAEQVLAARFDGDKGAWTIHDDQARTAWCAWKPSAAATTTMTTSRTRPPTTTASTGAEASAHHVADVTHRDFATVGVARLAAGEDMEVPAPTRTSPPGSSRVSSPSVT